MKHNGIGTLILQAAENHARINIKNVSCIQLGTPKEQLFESYHFYQKNGYTEYKGSYMKKQL
ncbi:MAG: GNAT family N-acetyltransferase [Clostridia bacterium]|nr:GNAT family N-acetyltransferase [Clostridia bacterium]